MNGDTQISPFALLQRIQVGLKASFGRKEAVAVYLGLPARTLPDEQSVKAVEDRMYHEYAVLWLYVPISHTTLLMRMVHLELLVLRRPLTCCCWPLIASLLE